VDGLWATKSEGVGLIVRAITLQDCQPMRSWSGIHQRHRQTDSLTDDMRSQYRALHYSASRGKNRGRKLALLFCFKLSGLGECRLTIKHATEATAIQQRHKTLPLGQAKYKGHG